MNGIVANESAGKQDDSHKTFLFTEIIPMNKLQELLKPLKDKKTASFNEKFAVMTAFNELPDEEKAGVQTEVDEVTARPEVEPTAPADTTKPADGEGTPTDAPAEFKETLNKIQQENAEMKAEIEKGKAEKLFSEKFAYSETTKKGIFNSKTQKDAFIKFHISLNETQKAEFGELIGGIDPKLFLAFSEIGSTATTSSKIEDEVAKIMKEKSCDYEEATRLYHEANK
jgi:hypothetical protein